MTLSLPGSRYTRPSPRTAPRCGSASRTRPGFGGTRGGTARRGGPVDERVRAAVGGKLVERRDEVRGQRVGARDDVVAGLDARGVVDDGLCVLADARVHTASCVSPGQTPFRSANIAAAAENAFFESLKGPAEHQIHEEKKQEHSSEECVSERFTIPNPSSIRAKVLSGLVSYRRRPDFVGGFEPLYM